MSSERKVPEVSWMSGLARRGARSLSLPFRRATADFVRGSLDDCGAFRDRSGQADLYYTFFGLECAAALGLPLPADAVAAWLEAFGTGEGLDLVHLSCLARCRRRLAGTPTPGATDRAVLERVERLQVPGGGYRLRAADGRDSIYACFIAGLTRAEWGLEPEDSAGIRECLRRFRSADGSWADVPDLPAGTTTVTSAAAALLLQLDGKADPEIAAWLRARQHPCGGFLPCPGAACPDLLSTATALLALVLLDVPLEPLRNAAREFVEATMSDRGGFTGHLFDPQPDCEYTWYGLLGLGLLGGGLP